MPGTVFHWSFDPILVSWGPVQIRWYGLIFVGAFFLGQFLLKRIFAREGVAAFHVDQLMLTSLAGTVIGARLVHCFAYYPAYYLAHPLEIASRHVNIAEGDYFHESILL